MDSIKENKEIYKRISTNVIGTDEDDDIQISLSALLELKKIIEENNISDDFYIRLYTTGGGCTGMIYNLKFDSEINENDIVFKTDSINFLIDTKSLFYFMGITIEYIDNIEGKGFVFKGINNLKTCGCNG